MGKFFFVIETINCSEAYSPENKIVIDIPAGVTIFQDQLGILEHVKTMAADLVQAWNDAYWCKPKVKKANN